VLREPLSHRPDIGFEHNVGDLLAPAFGEHIDDEVAQSRIGDNLSRRQRHFYLIDELRPDELQPLEFGRHKIGPVSQRASAGVLCLAENGHAAPPSNVINSLRLIG
jgi:hypothetical protein